MRTATLTLGRLPEARAAVDAAARFARNVLLFAAAPFIGLAYVLVGPFVGIAALAWMGVRAATTKAG